MRLKRKCVFGIVSRIYEFAAVRIQTRRERETNEKIKSFTKSTDTVMSHRIQQRSQCKHTLETYTTIYYPFVYHVPASRYNAEHTTVKTKLYYIISAVFLLLSFFSFPSQPPSLVSLSVRVSDRPCDVNFFLCLFIHPPSSYLFATRICTVQKW